MTTTLIYIAVFAFGYALGYAFAWATKGTRDLEDDTWRF